MTSIFLGILGMSLAASAAILAVLAARFPLRRAPKVFSYALWAVVLLRLLSPVSVRSPLPGGTEKSATMNSTVPTPAPQTGAHIGTGGALPYDLPSAPDTSEAEHDGNVSVPQTPAGQTPAAATPAAPAVRPAARDVLLAAASWVWFAGAAAMAARGVLRYVRLRRRLVGAVEEQDGVFLADGADVPFTLGLIRPRIYIPSDLGEREKEYVLAHERCHIRRGDNLTRVLAYAALCIHWFNPLVWAAFILSGRDMELSCDEAVLRRAPSDIRAEYATSILRYSGGTGHVAASPLSFGEGEPKSRIKNVMRFRKPAIWTVIIAGIVCAATVAIFATDAVRGREEVPAATFTHEDYEAYLESAETRYPKWAEPGTEIVYDGDGNYTVTLGALLSEDACRARRDEIGETLLPESDSSLIRPNTKAVYDRDGLLQNIYYEYPEGSGEYVLTLPETSLPDYDTALESWRTHYPQFAAPNTELYYGEGGRLARSDVGDMLSEEEYYERYGAATLPDSAAYPCTEAVYDESGALSEVRICLPGTDGVPTPVTADEVPSLTAPDGSDLSVRFAQLWYGANSDLVYGRTSAADTDDEVFFLRLGDRVLATWWDASFVPDDMTGKLQPEPYSLRAGIYDVLPYYFTEHGAERALANDVFLWKDGYPYRELWADSGSGNVGREISLNILESTANSMLVFVRYLSDPWGTATEATWPENHDDYERGALMLLKLVDGEWYIDDYEYMDALSDSGRNYDDALADLYRPKRAEPNTVVVYDEMLRPTVISGGLLDPESIADDDDVVSSGYIMSNSIDFYGADGRFLSYTARLVPGSRDSYVLANPNAASEWLPYSVTAEDGTDLTYRVGNLWAASVAVGKQPHYYYRVMTGEDGRPLDLDFGAADGFRRVPGTGELVSAAEAENYPGAYPCYATLEELGADIRSPLELWMVMLLAGEDTAQEPALILRDGVLYFPIGIENEYDETGGEITGVKVLASSPTQMTLEISYRRPDSDKRGTSEMTIVRAEDGVWELESINK